MIPKEIQAILDDVGLGDVATSVAESDSITLTMTKEEARALLDAWGYAIGPIVAAEIDDEKMNEILRTTLTNVWRNRTKQSKQAVESLTDKLTDIVDMFIAEELGQ